MLTAVFAVLTVFIDETLTGRVRAFDGSSHDSSPACVVAKPRHDGPCFGDYRRFADASAHSSAAQVRKLL
jgi:hypothetical protein